MADQPYYGDKYVGKDDDYKPTEPINKKNQKKIRDILKRLNDKKKASAFQTPNDFTWHTTTTKARNGM